MGDLDALSREFAREHSERLWKQLVVSASDDGAPRATAARTDAIVAFGLAVAAAAAVKVPALFGLDLDDDSGFYARNASLFVLPLLTGYFAWKRRLDPRTIGWLAAAFVVAAVFANVYPFDDEGSTEALTALHLPIALWLVVGIAYAGGRWSQVAGRMDFVRFSGELFIYFVLIALGGGVLTAFTAVMFNAIGIDPETFISEWLLPCGAAGAVLVAAWLVEAKQSVIENMAPVLTRLFTPLFAAVLVAFLGALLWTGGGLDVERDTLIPFDLLLVVVLGLLLYSISARDPASPAGLFDVLQVVLVVSCAPGRRGRALDDRRAHRRVRLQPEPRGRPRDERDPARQPRVVGGALPPFPATPGTVHRDRALADGLPARLRRVGGDRRGRLPAGLRLGVSRAQGGTW